MTRSLLLSLSAAFLAAPLTLAAQGTLSGQGFGFPPGQLSTRALGTGGAFAEFDPQTPINPASLATWGPSALLVQYEPEFRVVQVADEEAGSRLIRFPLIAVAFPAGRLTFGLSSSTLLDRTSSTSIQTETVIGSETIESIETFRSTGSISDLRLGVAWMVSDRFRAGAALSVLSGENRIFVGRVFLEPGFDSLSSRSKIGYSGFAGSLGVEVRPVNAVAIAVSGRIGGDVKAYVDDERRSSATVPDRIGMAVGFGGIRGVSLAARYDWEGWSSFGDLGSDRFTAYDTRAISVGAELAGPRIFGADLPLRIGGRWRTLPFSGTGSQVSESGFAAGFGIPLRFNRSNLDFAIQRVSRSDDGSTRERSWIVSLAVLVRP